LNTQEFGAFNHLVGFERTSLILGEVFLPTILSPAFFHRPLSIKYDFVIVNLAHPGASRSVTITLAATDFGSHGLR
jgi:hypothetical protein